MPINYKEYHPKWSLISRLIRYKRAKNKCEQCGIKNESIVKRSENNRIISSVELDMVHSYIRYGGHNMKTALKKHGFTKIILSVAHLDHNKKNNRF